jgi:hypothetical protein
MTDSVEGAITSTEASVVVAMASLTTATGAETGVAEALGVLGSLGAFAILTGAGTVTGVVETVVEAGAGEAEVFVVFAIVSCLYPL